MSGCDSSGSGLPDPLFYISPGDDSFHFPKFAEPNSAPEMVRGGESDRA
jgi:hypothetical protein